MFTTLFGKHRFGTQVAIGIIGSALLLAIGQQGFHAGQWIAMHLR